MSIGAVTVKPSKSARREDGYKFTSLATTPLIVKVPASLSEDSVTKPGPVKVNVVV
jgi:hypothetical protein